MRQQGEYGGSSLHRVEAALYYILGVSISLVSNWFLNMLSCWLRLTDSFQYHGLHVSPFTAGKGFETVRSTVRNETTKPSVPHC